MCTELKSEVVEYWTGRTEAFAALRQSEYAGEKRGQWTREILRMLPEGENLRILDAGTGTGFFSLLLGAMGHRVTGIDLTQSMVDRARAESLRLGIPAEFLVMDAESPDFPDQTFDLVVSRNLTWNLPHLERAYAEWLRVLKPGGRLINFDADYCRERSPDRPLPANHAHKSVSAAQAQMYEHLKEQLLPMQQPRPEWDRILLERCGYEDIQIDCGLSQRLYAQVDAFYNPTPMFALSARRGHC